MNWTRILLSSDQVSSGEIKNFHQAFRDTFHEAGMPDDMGLFAGLPNSNGEYPFYLTPACARLAPSLISDYSGSTCGKPRKSSFEPTLAIGFNKAWDLLLE